MRFFIFLVGTFFSMKLIEYAAITDLNILMDIVIGATGIILMQFSALYYFHDDTREES